MLEITENKLSKITTHSGHITIYLDSPDFLSHDFIFMLQTSHSILNVIELKNALPT